MSTISRHVEIKLGLPYPVTLVDSAELVRLQGIEDGYGITVPDATKLAEVLAISRCFQPQRLVGKEVHFLRRVLGMDIDVFGKHIGCDSDMLLRIENDNTVSDRILLMLALDHAIRQVVLTTLASRMTFIDNEIPVVEARVYYAGEEHTSPTWTVTWKYPSDDLAV